MRFREFFLAQELQGHLGSVQASSGLPAFQNQIKMHKPVTNKGTSVGRLMAAGKVKNPARPVSFTTPNKPMTVPSLLK